MLKMDRQRNEKRYRTAEKTLSEIIGHSYHGLTRPEILGKCGLYNNKVRNYLEIAVKFGFLVSDEKKIYKPTRKADTFYQSSKLQNRLLATCGDNDPHINPEKKDIMETASSSLRGIVTSITDSDEKNAEVDIFGNKVRNTYRIIQQIIDNATGDKTKFETSRDSSINYQQLDDYLFKLMKINMIKSNKQSYKSTLKGQLFSDHYKVQKCFTKVWEKEDPLANPELTAKIVSAVSPVLSLPIQPTVLTDIFEEYIVIKR
jgi:predicted transcriptional regulator